MLEAAGEQYSPMQRQRRGVAWHGAPPALNPMAAKPDTSSIHIHANGSARYSLARICSIPYPVAAVPRDIL